MDFCSEFRLLGSPTYPLLTPYGLTHALLTNGLTSYWTQSPIRLPLYGAHLTTIEVTDLSLGLHPQVQVGLDHSRVQRDIRVCQVLLPVLPNVLLPVFLPNVFQVFQKF